MRYLLFSLLLALFIHPIIPLQAQCTISNASVKLNYSTPNASGGCDINLDLYFDMQSNAGGKYVYVHIWPQSLYPTLIYNNPPTPAQLTNAVATMGFYHFGSNLYMLDSYTPYPTIPNYKFTGLSIVKSTGSIAGSDRFTIQNITITGAADCNVAQEFTADLWQSQSASAQNVHCFSRGLNFFANDPRITGFLICDPPRQYRFQIKTIDPAGLSVNYKVFIDNGDGVYNASTDIIEIASATGISLNSTNSFTYNSPLMGYLPYSNQKPEAGRALWIVVTSPTRSNTALARLDNNCALLPIQCGSFTARYADQRAAVEWTTLTEIDNRGFEIERKNKVDEQPFRSVGFVPSQASGGNSTDELRYSFTDPNPIQEATLYRIKQIDHSGKTNYSPIRTLNTDQLMSQLQPNPAHEQLQLIFSRKTSYYLVEWIGSAG
ncbi:MAG: hypothetical protein FJX92_08240 [Bacteroidetes bacterium]|nr:hypothetical protein [Bacteroidota bacterium]